MSVPRGVFQRVFGGQQRVGRAELRLLDDEGEPLAVGERCS